MKGYMKVAAALAALTMAQTANAIEVRYSFRVNSSGPSIYPCNAGLMTDDTDDGDKVCYTADTHEACTPACVGLDCDGDQTPPQHPKPSGIEGIIAMTTSPSHGDDCQKDEQFNSRSQHCEKKAPPRNNCVCSTEKGRRYANYVHADYGYWGELTDPHTDQTSGSYKFEKLFNENDAYGKVLKNLSFNLGSELYSAKYFVDICYRGSQIDYSEFLLKYNLLAEASVSDFKTFGSAGGYKKLSGLKAKAYLICDVQKRDCHGSECDDHDANPMRDPEAAVFGNNSSFWNVLNGANFDYETHTNSLQDYSSDTSGQFKTLINKNYQALSPSHAAARFCKVRYVFEETDHKAKSPNFRKWQKHGANICTKTKIEPAYFDEKHMRD